jgi:hypothetical protein
MAVSMKTAVFRVVAPLNGVLVALKMKAARTSENSVNV